MTTPDDVDLIAAALRADAADLEVYADVLMAALADALPAGMVRVERRRSLGDRLAGRPGTVESLHVSVGDKDLTLTAGAAGGLPAGHVRQRVRGVVIASRDVGLDEWARTLAVELAEHSRQSAEARTALARLLGQA